jgi:alkaline phosphatase D
MQSAVAARLLLAASIALALGGCARDFDLGVAAFEVGSDRVLLWTHVVPRHSGPPVLLAAEVATDAAFHAVVRRSFALARASADYTVRARVRHLEPATHYYYRFVTWPPLRGKQRASRTGHFLTAPAPDERAPLRFVISGDSNVGFAKRFDPPLDFYVLDAAADEEPDFFVYFGDTIYADSGALPGGADAFELDEYREVHRLTRADPHLQRLLAATGTYAGWDDHEVANDYDGESVDPGRFANGARAFFEYLPVRAQPGRRNFRIHRRVRWGRDVELFLIDGRQFRSAERFCNETLPDGPETDDTLFSPYTQDEEIAAELLPPAILELAAPLLVPSDPECVERVLADPARTVLGREQLEWLEQALLGSDATWKIVVNNTPIATILSLPYDRWEGYPVERQELLDFVAAHLDPDHTLFLTTDFHTNLGLRRSELTELIVGPIATGTFGRGILQNLPPEVRDFGDLVVLLLGQLFDRANGSGSLLGQEADAFSYAVIEIADDEQGVSRLRATVRGDPDYADGANDAARVADLFSFELP